MGLKVEVTAVSVASLGPKALDKPGPGAETSRSDPSAFLT